MDLLKRNNDLATTWHRGGTRLWVRFSLVTNNIGNRLSTPYWNNRVWFWVRLALVIRGQIHIMGRMSGFLQ
jgi:hypothetical protein